jgi:CBS domain containing-hemolysin-like protein
LSEKAEGAGVAFAGFSEQIDGGVGEDLAFEFGLVASRQGVLEEQAAAGDRRAQAAVKQLSQLSFVLSSAQFGITATSLVVGFLAEDALGAAVVTPVLELLGVGDH